MASECDASAEECRLWLSRPWGFWLTCSTRTAVLMALSRQQRYLMCCQMVKLGSLGITPMQLAGPSSPSLPLQTLMNLAHSSPGDCLLILEAGRVPTGTDFIFCFNTPFQVCFWSKLAWKPGNSSCSEPSCTTYVCLVIFLHHIQYHSLAKHRITCVRVWWDLWHVSSQTPHIHPSGWVRRVM
jgi:hypothetical protein